jgi:hypothetical protein
VRKVCRACNQAFVLFVIEAHDSAPPLAIQEHIGSLRLKWRGCRRKGVASE